QHPLPTLDPKAALETWRPFSCPEVRLSFRYPAFNRRIVMLDAFTLHYTSAGGLGIRRRAQPLPYHGACDTLISELDSQRGVLLSSSYEYPGRYRRHDIGFSRPPLLFEASDSGLRIAALNARGSILLAPL